MAGQMVSTYVDPMGRKQARIVIPGASSVLITREGTRTTPAGQTYDLWRVWRADNHRFGIARGTFRQAVTAARKAVTR